MLVRTKWNSVRSEFSNRQFGRNVELANAKDMHIDAVHAQIDDRFKNSDMYKLVDSLNSIETGLGDKFFSIVASYRQRNNGWDMVNGVKTKVLEDDIYEKDWAKKKKELQKLKDEKFKIPFLKKEITGKEVFDLLNQKTTEWSKDSFEAYGKNQIEEEKFIERYKLYDEHGYLNLDKTAEVLERELLAKKPVIKGANFIRRIEHQLMLENIGLDPVKHFNHIDNLNVAHKKTE